MTSKSYRDRRGRRSFSIQFILSAHLTIKLLQSTALVSVTRLLAIPVTLLTVTIAVRLGEATLANLARHTLEVGTTASTDSLSAFDASLAMIRNALRCYLAACIRIRLDRGYISGDRVDLLVTLIINIFAGGIRQNRFQNHQIGIQ